MDRLNAMEVFVCVADAKSFAKAAEILDISAPSVTKAVQALEDYLSVRLLQRTTRKLSLTPEGEDIYDSCRRIIGEVSDLASGAGENRTPFRGRLRIDMPASLAKQVVVPELGKFLAAHPELEISLGVTDKSVDLVEAGIDCAVRVGKNSDSSLIAHQIGAMRRVVCATPGYLAEHGTPDSVQSLAGHAAIRYFPRGGWRDVAQEFPSEAKLIDSMLKSAIAVNDVDTYLSCGMQGMGLMLVGRYLVQEHLDSGALVEVLPTWKTTPSPISIIYPARRHLPPRVRTFISWISDVFARHPSLCPLPRGAAADT